MANKKRFLAILLTVLMFVQMMPASLAATLTSNPVGDDYFQVVFMDGESTIATQYIKEGGALVLPEDPAHNGYEFAGWFSGDTQYNAGDAVNADLTLNARFNAIVRYTVTIQYVKVENGADVPVATPVVREYAASETDVVDSIDSPEVEALFPDQNPVTITVADLPDLVDENGAYTIRVVYSATSTDYAIHHLFENVDGTEFVHDPAYDETGHGVVGTRVTPMHWKRFRPDSPTRNPKR